MLASLSIDCCMPASSTPPSLCLVGSTTHANCRLCRELYNFAYREISLWGFQFQFHRLCARFALQLFGDSIVPIDF